MNRLPRWHVALWLAASLAAAPGAWAGQGPQIGYIYPAGGRQGTVVEVAVGGQRLAGVSHAYVTGDGVEAKVIGYLRNLSTGQLNRLAQKLREVGEFHSRRRTLLMPESGTMQMRSRAATKPTTAMKPLSRAEAREREEKAGKLGLLAAKAGDQFETLARQLGLHDASVRGYYVLRQRLADPKRQPNPQIAETATLRITLAPDAEPGLRELRLRTASGVSNTVFFQVGQHREYLETEPNDRKPDGGVLTGKLVDEEPETPESLSVGLGGQSSPGEVAGLDIEIPNMESLPVVLNGQIMPGDVDRFRLRINKGTRVVAAVTARALVPFMADAVPGWFQATLKLSDPKGKELAFADDFRFDPDPVIYYEIPESGEYILEIRDSIYRGREDFVYRIALGQVPFITHAFPLGGRAGVKTVADIHGWNLPTKRLPLDTRPGEPSIRQAALRKGGTRTNEVVYAVNTLAEESEAEPNDDTKRAQHINLPRIINGRIARPGDVDVFRFDGKAGDEVVADVQARRLHSPLDSVLRLIDASGKVVAWNDDYMPKDGHLHRDMGLLTHHADSYLKARLPTDGVYYVRLSDMRDHGSGAHAYRLRISPPQHSFVLHLSPSSLSVPAGGVAPFTVHALRKDGFDGEIELVLKDAPAGFALRGARIPSGRVRVTMTLAAPQRPLNRPVTLRLEGRAQIDGKTISRPVHPSDNVMQAFLWRHLAPSRQFIVAVTRAGWPASGVALASGDPVRVPAGGTAQVRLKTPRRPKGEMKLALKEPPPKGVSLHDVKDVPDGVVFGLKVEGDAAKAGFADNLIVEASAEYEVTSTNKKTGKTTKQKRRDSLGTLPAIPFVVVQP